MEAEAETSSGEKDLDHFLLRAEWPRAMKRTTIAGTS